MFGRERERIEVDLARCISPIPYRLAWRKSCWRYAFGLSVRIGRPHCCRRRSSANTLRWRTLSAQAEASRPRTKWSCSWRSTRISRVARDRYARRCHQPRHALGTRRGKSLPPSLMVASLPDGTRPPRPRLGMSCPNFWS